MRWRRKRSIADATIEDEDRYDVERRMAEQPAQRLFRAHPALGLEEGEGTILPSLDVHKLGVRWLALEPDEQRRRESDFLRALLERARRYPDARFEALCDDDESPAALAARTAAQVTDDEAVEGALTATAIDGLAGDLPETLMVDGGPDVLILTTDGWMGLGVLVDRWKAPALERELIEAWWQEADRRAANDERLPELRRRHAAESEFRAHALVVWKRSSRMLVSGLVLLWAALPWPLLDGGVGDLVLLAVGAFAIRWPLDSLMERWYHRRGRRPGGPESPPVQTVPVKDRR